jgi:hypothetical protein
MSLGAWIMFLIGAVGLWGGLAYSLWHYLNAEKRARSGRAR